MKIAVLSRNPKLYSTRRLLEAIEQRGHEGLIIDHLKCDIIIDDEGPSLYYQGEKLKDIDAVIQELALL